MEIDDWGLRLCRVAPCNMVQTGINYHKGWISRFYRTLGWYAYYTILSKQEVLAMLKPRVIDSRSVPNTSTASHCVRDLKFYLEFIIHTRI